MTGKMTESEFGDLLDKLYDLHDKLKSFLMQEGTTPTFNQLQRMVIAQRTWNELVDQFTPRLLDMDTIQREHLALLTRRMDGDVVQIRQRIEEVGHPDPSIAI